MRLYSIYAFWFLVRLESRQFLWICVENVYNERTTINGKTAYRTTGISYNSHIFYTFLYSAPGKHCCVIILTIPHNRRLFMCPCNVVNRTNHVWISREHINRTKANKKTAMNSSKCHICHRYQIICKISHYNDNSVMSVSFTHFAILYR